SRDRCSTPRRSNACTNASNHAAYRCWLVSGRSRPSSMQSSWRMKYLVYACPIRCSSACGVLTAPRRPLLRESRLHEKLSTRSAPWCRASISLRPGGGSTRRLRCSTASRPQPNSFSLFDKAENAYSQAFEMLFDRENEDFGSDVATRALSVTAVENAFVNRVYEKLAKVYDVVFGPTLHHGRLVAIERMA